MDQVYHQLKIVFIGAFFLIFLTVPISCNKYKRKKNQLPVMTVGKYSLSAKEFARRVSEHIKSWSLLELKDKKKVQIIKNKILDDYVFEAIVQGWGAKNNIHITELELKKEIEKQQKNYPNQNVFFFTLSKAGISVEEWKKKIKTNLLNDKLKEDLNKNIPPPTEGEIHQFYTENKSQFQLKPLIFLRQIVLREKFKADILRKKLNKNNFKEMAENFSISPEKEKGGAVGWIEKGRISLFKRAFRLRVGKISRVVASPYGYHIFLVEKKVIQKKDLLERAKIKVAKTLMEQKRSKYFQNWLKKQIQSTKVYKDLNLIDNIEISIKK